MAIHVPFSERPSGKRHRQPPLYIGFDLPRRQRPKFNWWGFNGLLLFFLSLGLLSPITLLISAVGLKKRPRKLAIAGTMLSLIGVSVMALIPLAAYKTSRNAQIQHEYARQRMIVAEQIMEGQQLLAQAASEYEQYRDENQGRLPRDLDGNSLALKYLDPWNESLLYEVNPDFVLLRSSGPDKKFYSRDDLTFRIDGTTDYQPLLPVDEEASDN